jgi:DNA mismatch endonuclease, patch repair protein
VSSRNTQSDSRDPRNPRKCRTVTDIMSPRKRSMLMSRIRSKDTTPEVELRAALRNARVRFRSYRRVGGVHVDLALPELKVAVLVHGCFWHGCHLHYTSPANNSGFWREKLQRNRSRDRRQIRALRAAGWIPIVVWEHSIRKGGHAPVERILRLSRQMQHPTSVGRQARTHTRATLQW